MDQQQTPEERERFQRYLMANLTNAIMSNYFHQHDDDVDSDDDDDEYYEDEDDDEEVGKSHPDLIYFQYGF